MPSLKNIFLTKLRTNSKEGVVRLCAIELWNKLASYMSLALFCTEQNIKGTLLKYMARNASMEQLQACGLKDIASQLEFQRLIKEKSEGASSGDTDIVTLSPSLTSSTSSSNSGASASGQNPSRRHLKNMSTLDARIYKVK